MTSHDGVPLRPPIDLERVEELCRELGHVNLAAAAHGASKRMDEEAAVVCFVGEFKQGKSSLLNAVLGTATCPVSDEFATSAITLVTHGAEPSVTVHRDDGEQASAASVELSDVWRYASERGASQDRQGVSAVEIRLPNPILEKGLVFVDTPGVGGLNPAYISSMLALMPVVDSAVFVTDASAELSAIELGLLEQIQARGPILLVALTKTDLHPHWRQIAELNRDHLVNRGIEAPILPLSSPLREIGLVRDDRELNQESGVPELLGAFRSNLLDDLRASRHHRASRLAHSLLGQLERALEAEGAAIEDPESAKAALADLAAVDERLTELRRANARWAIKLSDGFLDVRTEVDLRLRTAIRDARAYADREIDGADPASEWAALMQGLQGHVVDSVEEVFKEMSESAQRVSDEVADLVKEDALTVEDIPESVDLVLPHDIEPTLREPSRSKRTLEWGLGALRGAQSGGFMLAWLASAVGVAMGAPIILGAGGIFGVKFVIDERRRNLDVRRRDAKTAANRYLDEVQLQIGGRMQHVLQEMQRSVRDHYQDLIQSMLERNDASARQMREALQLEAGARRQRLETVRADLEQVRSMRDGLGSIEGAGH